LGGFLWYIINKKEGERAARDASASHLMNLY
jgi:hypothetical protein